MDLRRTVRADFQREKSRSDRLTVLVMRVGQWATEKPARVPVRVAHRIVDMAWTRMIVGAELPSALQCGPGLRLRHWGRGIIIHPEARLGSNVTLYHRVTIGAGEDGRTPCLGDNVYVGTGASIIGGVTIGDGARIAAGAVVVRDVPAGGLAVGVPAHRST